MYLYRAMRVSENTLKWVMRFYPPLFFQRIWTRRFHPGFKGVDVSVRRSMFNRNYNASIFGGTLFAASDPFYALLFDQIFKRKGYKTRVWLKSASIQYVKPAYSRVSFTIKLSDQVIERANQQLQETGKFVATFPIEMKDEKGVTCVIVSNEVYIRLLSTPDHIKNHDSLF